jgi:hypothetical protein
MAVAGASASIFAILVGSGTWLVDATAPMQLDREVWVASLLLTGTAGLAWCWRLAAQAGDGDP